MIREKEVSQWPRTVFPVAAFLVSVALVVAVQQQIRGVNRAQVGALEHLTKIASYVQVRAELVRHSIEQGANLAEICSKIRDIREKVLILSADSSEFEILAEKSLDLQTQVDSLASGCEQISNQISVVKKLARVRDLSRDFILSAEHAIPADSSLNSVAGSYPMPLPDAPAGHPR